MTLQNRVDPWGKLNAHPSKSATLMGNRGTLHNQQKQVTKQWDGRAWISCLLNHKNIQRKVFGDSYSELFFLDEATAFAAGHRPCWQCQPERHTQFKQLWGNVHNAGIKLSVKDIDQKIHQDRLTADKKKKTFQAQVSDLPIGTFFEHDSKAIVIFKDNHYLVWSFDGYQQEVELPNDLIVNVLTPESFVKAFDEGFIPRFHHSASFK